MDIAARIAYHREKRRASYTQRVLKEQRKKEKKKKKKQTHPSFVGPGNTIRAGAGFTVNGPSTTVSDASDFTINGPSASVRNCDNFKIFGPSASVRNSRNGTVAGPSASIDAASVNVTSTPQHDDVWFIGDGVTMGAVGQNFGTISVGPGSVSITRGPDGRRTTTVVRTNTRVRQRQQANAPYPVDDFDRVLSESPFLDRDPPIVVDEEDDDDEVQIISSSQLIQQQPKKKKQGKPGPITYPDPLPEKDEQPIATNDAEQCIVCMDLKATTIMIPCGHICLCRRCVEKLKPRTCLYCKQDITCVNVVRRV
jgi:hypothetical protein